MPNALKANALFATFRRFAFLKQFLEELICPSVWDIFKSTETIQSTHQHFSGFCDATQAPYP